MTNISNSDPFIRLVRNRVTNVNEEDVYALVLTIDDQLGEHHTLGGCLTQVTNPKFHACLSGSVQDKFL